mgnify:FL=1
MQKILPKGWKRGYQKGDGYDKLEKTERDS